MLSEDFKKTRASKIEELHKNADQMTQTLLKFKQR